MALVDFRNETARYGDRTILSNINLTIEDGEKIALVGESGAGKSTLLRMIYDDCCDVAALVPQDLGLVQSLTVFHNVYMGRLHTHTVWHNFRNLLKPVTRDVEEVRPVLQRLRLEEKLYSSVGELSGGQQQRTAVGRALFHPGEVLIADEPVSAVDDHQARDILEAIREEKNTVVLAMHDRALAIEFSGRLIGIKEGRIVLDEKSDGMIPADLDHLYQTHG